MDLRIRGAREHNLRGVDLDLPRGALIVFCGVSGSGKSSLAFDTLHAESQRRFVEALSSWVRQQLGQSARPAYDQLTGLTPSIGVAQRGASAPGPRATVGTLTEVLDLLRVLYARAGTLHCPTCDDPVVVTPLDAIVRRLLTTPEGTPLVVAAPVARARPGSVRPLLDALLREGFARVRIDGVTHMLDEAPVVDARELHDVDVVVDRLRAGPDRAERLQDGLATALRAGRGAVLVDVGDARHTFTTRPRCIRDDREFPEVSPRLFSFNSPVGACPACQGLGVVRAVDPDRLVDAERTLADGAVEGWSGAARPLLEAAATRRGIPLDVPWRQLPWQARDALLFGDGEIEGAVAVARRQKGARAERWWRETPCEACDGSRLGELARHVRVAGVDLPTLARMTLDAAHAHLAALPPSPVVAPLREELLRRLDFLLRTGLGYVTLERRADTLSGGELQRIRLGAQAGNQLSGVLYVLDEPTAGLHPADTARLLDVLRELRDAGNTVLVVEHDLDVVRAADLVVEFGPGAGGEGGRVVFAGSPASLLGGDTLTGRWLSGRAAPAAHARLAPRAWITLRGLRGHNLHGDARLPLGVLAAVTGVSGAGKSSLVDDTLGRALARLRSGAAAPPLPCDGIDGLDAVRRLVRVDASPVGRSARSNPATLARIWDPIRQLLARTPEARARGFGPDHFSFNGGAGRCPACQGEGVRRVAMEMLPDVVVPCEVCEGRRFDEATLAATWKGVDAAAMLAMSVRDARRLFGAVAGVAGPLETLDALGLGYLPLGQPGDTLSGGEAQRVKLARELGRPGDVAGTLYLLDEPSVGLHPADVAMLLEALRRLVTQGGSVLAVEHDPVFLGACDWVVELGPGAGAAGGGVVSEGPPAARPGQSPGQKPDASA